MLDLVSKAWETNKVKFLLVAIPIVLMLLSALFFKAWRGHLLSSAKKLLEKVSKKNDQLSTESDAANREADEKKAKADELKKKADSVEEDPDWNKKL